jgi:cytochrome b6-f complex iron-sulfur subunit
MGLARRRGNWKGTIIHRLLCVSASLREKSFRGCPHGLKPILPLPTLPRRLSRIPMGVRLGVRYKRAMATNIHITRRELMGLGAAIAAASVCEGCRLVGSRKADVSVKQDTGTIQLTPEQSSQLLSEEGSLLIKSQGVKGKILAIHARDGHLYAVNSVCTHMGCDVLYDKDLGHIRCPCHGSEYGLDGHNIKGPAKRPLASYRITNDNGQVVIQV